MFTNMKIPKAMSYTGKTISQQQSLYDENHKFATTTLWGCSTGERRLWDLISVISILIAIFVAVLARDTSDAVIPWSKQTGDSAKSNLQSISSAQKAPTQPDLVHDLDLIQLLDHSGISKPREPHDRLVFIGDIHGCIKELLDLLRKLEYDREKDLLITTGDMINKGPDSAAVVEFLRNHNALCVRGNHDDVVLRTLHELAGMEQVQNPDESAAGYRAVEATVALSLSPEQITYLESCPVILNLGKVGMSHLVVVHAGLVPSLPLRQQVASHVMNMRIIDEVTHEPSPKHNKNGSIPWFQLWNKYQDLSLQERLEFVHGAHAVDTSVMTVIYGHDAKKGLQIHKYTRGLDTKCVAGGQLTALIVDQNGRERFVQTGCPEYHK